jgi:predicted transcriptional regulator
MTLEAIKEAIIGLPEAERIALIDWISMQSNDYDAWFEQEVVKGMAAANRGEFVEHEEIGRLINSRYPG